MESELKLIREQLNTNFELLREILTRLSPVAPTTGTMLPIVAAEITRKGKRWTDKEDEELYEKFRQGSSWDDLATAHQRTAGALKIRMGSLLKKELDTGVTLAQLAEVLKRSEVSLMELIASNRYTRT